MPSFVAQTQPRASRAIVSKTVSPYSRLDLLLYGPVETKTVQYDVASIAESSEVARPLSAFFADIEAQTITSTALFQFQTAPRSVRRIVRNSRTFASAFPVAAQPYNISAFSFYSNLRGRFFQSLSRRSPNSVLHFAPTALENDFQQVIPVFQSRSGSAPKQRFSFG